MDRSRFDEYVRRFNAEEASAFDEFLSPAVQVRNGGLHYQGVEGMKQHFGRIWGRFREILQMQRFVSDNSNVAVHLNTHFETLVDGADTSFGSVRHGECFDYDGIVYDTLDKDERFRCIPVSCLAFERSDLNGVRRSLGLAH